MRVLAAPHGPSRGTRASASSRGWLLIGLIVLISTVAIAFAAFTLLLTEHLRVASLRQNQTKAIYLAQAGIMQAIYDFRQTGGGVGFLLGEYPVPADTGTIGSYADDDVFILGGQAADFLLAAMIPATWATAGICGGALNRQVLQNWTLRNVLLTSSATPSPPDNLPHGMPVVINQLQITWSPDNGERVYRVDLMGTTANYTSCTGTPSGGIITVNQTVAPNSQGSNRIWFSRRTTENSPPSLLMNNKSWIEIRCIMTDGSVRRVRFLPATPTASSASFTIKSVGEVRKGAFPFSVWRRLQAEYRLNDSDTNVSDLQEVGKITADLALPALPSNEQRPGYLELSQKQP